MRATSSVKTEEGTDEIVPSRLPPEEGASVSRETDAPPPCLAELGEPWLRAHYYRTQEVLVKRLQLQALCAISGHKACALKLHLRGLPVGADRHTWDGSSARAGDVE